MITKNRTADFIVVRPGTAVPTPATRLYDFTTDQVNLPLGGIGVYAPVVNSGNPVVTALAPTVTNAPSLRFIVRRDTTLDTTPLPEKQLIESAEIKPTCKLRAVGLGAAVKNNSAWLIGAPNSVTVGNVPVNDEVEYIVNASTHGWRTDLYNGLNTPLRQGRFTTPDYFSSTLYTTVNQRRDHLLHNLAYDFNRQVGQVKEIVAICIDSAGTAPNAGLARTLTSIVALPAGTNIVIGFTDEGQAINLQLDRELIAMFTELIAAGVPGTAKVVPYARPTAQNLAVATRIVAGGRTAGTPQSTVDHVLFVALNQKRAAYDEIHQTKERVFVGLEGGFDDNVTSSRMIVNPSEGHGYGRDLYVQYSGSQGYRMYPGGRNWQANHVEFAHEILKDGIYDMFIIEHCEERTASNGLPSVSPRVTKIAVLNTETPGFAGFTGVANPQKAYIQNLINSWMASTPYPHTTIAI